MSRLSLFVLVSGCVTLTLAACGDDTATGGSGGTGAGSTGGQAQGAGSQGGAAQGGAAQGGAAQGGMGTGGGGGAPAPAPECTQDSDCFTNSDCCECAGHPNGEVPPACAIDCVIDTCAAKGIDAAVAVCAAGRCVTEASCNDSVVTCDTPTPQCAAGESPIVVGSCYAGGCLPSLECRDVTSCASCSGAGITCVVDAAFTQTSHCVDAQGCSPADCACLGESVCVGAFNVCSDVMGHIECACPACLF